MELRFPQRVALEREALDAVNLKFGEIKPLVGLSYSAVQTWASNMKSVLDLRAIDRLVVAVHRIAEAARSEADVSDEIFVDVDPLKANEALATLREVLAEL